MIIRLATALEPRLERAADQAHAGVLTQVGADASVRREAQVRRRLLVEFERLLLLMDEHGLDPNDLVDAFGSKGNASEVLGGKRSISKAHAVRLGERLHVSPFTGIDRRYECGRRSHRRPAGRR